MIAPSNVLLIPANAENEPNLDGGSNVYAVYTLTSSDSLGAVGMNPDTGRWKFQSQDTQYASITTFASAGDAAAAMLSEETL